MDSRAYGAHTILQGILSKLERKHSRFWESHLVAQIVADNEAAFFRISRLSELLVSA